LVALAGFISVACYKSQISFRSSGAKFLEGQSPAAFTCTPAPTHTCSFHQLL